MKFFLVILGLVTLSREISCSRKTTKSDIVTSTKNSLIRDKKFQIHISPVFKVFFEKLSDPNNKVQKPESIETDYHESSLVSENSDHSSDEYYPRNNRIVFRNGNQIEYKERVDSNNDTSVDNKKRKKYKRKRKNKKIKEEKNNKRDHDKTEPAFKNSLAILNQTEPKHQNEKDHKKMEKLYKAIIKLSEGATDDITTNKSDVENVTKELDDQNINTSENSNAKNDKTKLGEKLSALIPILDKRIEDATHIVKMGDIESDELLPYTPYIHNQKEDSLLSGKSSESMNLDDDNRAERLPTTQFVETTKENFYLEYSSEEINSEAVGIKDDDDVKSSTKDKKPKMSVTTQKNDEKIDEDKIESDDDKVFRVDDKYPKTTMKPYVADFEYYTNTKYPKPAVVFRALTRKTNENND